MVGSSNGPGNIPLKDKIGVRTSYRLPIFRGLAQMVARVLWEHEAVGSRPASPTIHRLVNPLSQSFLSFLKNPTDLNFDFL